MFLRLAADIYASRAHFVLELLQNADDNEYAEGVTLGYARTRCSKQGSCHNKLDSGFSTVHGIFKEHSKSRKFARPT